MIVLKLTTHYFYNTVNNDYYKNYIIALSLK